MLDHDDRVLRRQLRPRAPAACIVAGVLLWLTGLGNIVLGTLLLFRGGGPDIGLTLLVLLTGILLMVAGRFVVRAERLAVYGSLLATELLLALAVLGPTGSSTASLVGQLLLLVLTLALALAALQLARRDRARRRDPSGGT